MNLDNKYIEALKKLFAENDFPTDAFYIDKAFGGKDIILYGAGEASHWFVEIVIKMHGYKPIAVLDKSFSTATKFEGINAYPPEEYNPSDGIKKSAIVVICVTNKKYHSEITKTLKKLGFNNIISLLDIYEIHNPFNLPLSLREKKKKYFIGEKENIIAASKLFEDDLSKEVYFKFAKTHLQRKPLPISSSSRDEQYFPNDINLSKGYSKFINCGAYDGDVVRLLNKKVGKIDELICFEPEPEIYKRLSNYLKINNDRIANKIISLPNAVYDKEKIVKFKSGFGLGSRISADGGSLVQTVSLDSLFPNFNPTFICMDVEGAEPKVLEGATSLITRSKPDLAICVYHSPNHIWEIPLYLNSLNLGYNFYLRNYTSFCIETVLYATTKI